MALWERTHSCNCCFPEWVTCIIKLPLRDIHKVETTFLVHRKRGKNNLCSAMASVTLWIELKTNYYRIPGMSYLKDQHRTQSWFKSSQLTHALSETPLSYQSEAFDPGCSYYWGGVTGTGSPQSPQSQLKNEKGKGTCYCCNRNKNNVITGHKNLFFHKILPNMVFFVIRIALITCLLYMQTQDLYYLHQCACRLWSLLGQLPW